MEVSRHIALVLVARGHDYCTGATAATSIDIMSHGGKTEEGAGGSGKPSAEQLAIITKACDPEINYGITPAPSTFVLADGSEKVDVRVTAVPLPAPAFTMCCCSSDWAGVAGACRTLCPKCQLSTRAQKRHTAASS